MSPAPTSSSSGVLIPPTPTIGMGNSMPPGVSIPNDQAVEIAEDANAQAIGSMATESLSGSSASDVPPPVGAPTSAAPDESAIAEALANLGTLEAETAQPALSQPSQVQPIASPSVQDAQPLVVPMPVSPISPVIGGMPASPMISPGQSVIAPPGQITNLLDALVADKELDQSTADTIMVNHISTGQPIEELLTKENLVNETALTKAKSTLNNVPLIDLSQVGIYPEALNRLPEGVARSYKMLPFELNKDEGTLSVAMINPLDLSAIDFAQQKTGLRIQAFFALPSEIERLLAEYYSQSLSTEVTEAIEQATQTGTNKKKIDYSSLSKQTIRQAPISKIVDTILTFAIKARASDVHIEPLEEHTRVRYRIDGILVEKLILPRSVHDAVVSRIKILSGLKIDEKRVPQDGRFNFVALDQEVDLRVSTLPTIHGEKIVMRLLKKDQKVPTMPELGLNGIALRNVQDSIKVPHGIVLITGPTGSGKTTTLYSILHVINSPRVNIMTLEDPVEYQMQGVNQVQINPQAGLSFASGLRSFLRQDPNIIMVGEIRDSETAELAIQASLTGHLVFSTLHTSSAAGAIPRLMDMGAEPFLLASSMTLVMAQRVMRLIHPDFKEQYKPEPAVLADIRAVLGDRLDAWCRQKGKQCSGAQR